MDAAEYGRRLAAQHDKQYPLSAKQIEAAARILATVEPAEPPAKARAA